MKNRSPLALSLAASLALVTPGLAGDPEVEAAVAAALRAADPPPDPAPREAPPRKLPKATTPGLVEITVVGRKEQLAGEVDAASTGRVGPDEVMARPLLRPGEILEHVPGLTVTQHSATGKANQYFLRGFNLDHGTDLATRVDGVPVNMPTHGHGQGYMDLNFMIPELVESMTFRKGPYHATSGDFSSAGAVDVRLKDRLDEGIAQVEVGGDGWQRYLVADSVDTERGTFLYAMEANGYDGPWDVAEDLERYNLYLRYSEGDEDAGYRLGFSAYGADWTSTDQIPQREVRAGRLSRLGSLDPTTGGATRRTALTASMWRPRGDNGHIRLSTYALKYDLDLFSNFTYLLDDPVNGDQFNQVDDRTVWGLDLERDWEGDLGRRPVKHTVGLRVRRDDIAAVGLHQTQARRRVSTVREDSVDQLSAGVFYQAEVDWTSRLRATLGLRAHRYLFDVTSHTLAANSGTREGNIGNYDVGLAYQKSERTEYYLKHGTGFHSNDARGTTIAFDPASGNLTAPVDPLVRSRGSELGVRTGFSKDHRMTVSLWTLDLDSELLFVGDAGNTEASRPSRRHGIEWTNHLTLSPVFTLHADYSHSNAYFRDSDPAGNEIPNSVEDTIGAGLSFELPDSGFFGGLHLRAFRGRPLIEDGSVRAGTTKVVNAQFGRKRGRWSWRFDVLNLFDSTDDDITYFFDSRLAGEPAGGVSDIHSHPVVPRTVRLAVTRRF